MGLKPMTHGTGNHCSIQLSYGAIVLYCKSKELFGINKKNIGSRRAVGENRCDVK